MNILKNVEHNSVTLQVHRVMGVRYTRDIKGNESFAVIVHSWMNEAHMAAGNPPFHQFTEVLESTFLPEGKLEEVISELIVSKVDSTLFEGVLQPYTHGEATLSQLQDKKWAYIKHRRALAIDSDLTTPYGVFQLTTEDRKNITDAVMLLQTMEAAGTPTTVSFTLKDNSVAVLTTSEMVTVALLMGQKIQTAYATARALRADIYDELITLEALDAIDWPAE